jgi:hypothetical protein
MSVIAYAGTTTTTETFFAEGDCFEKNQYCELIDFRGISHTYWFGDSIDNPEESLYENVDFFVGGIGSGISCERGLCKNANNEVIGLDPKWPAFAGAVSSAGSIAPETASQPVVQQSAEPPYQLGSKVVDVGSRDYPIPQNKLIVVSKVNGLVIHRITVNGGNNKCMSFDENKSMSGKKRSNLNMGDDISLPIPNVCNLFQIDIETNMGSWTHSF